MPFLYGLLSVADSRTSKAKEAPDATPVLPEGEELVDQTGIEPVTS